MASSKAHGIAETMKGSRDAAAAANLDELNRQTCDLELHLLPPLRETSGQTGHSITPTFEKADLSRAWRQMSLLQVARDKASITFNQLWIVNLGAIALDCHASSASQHATNINL